MLAPAAAVWRRAEEESFSKCSTDYLIFGIFRVSRIVHSDLLVACDIRGKSDCFPLKTTQQPLFDFCRFVNDKTKDRLNYLKRDSHIIYVNCHSHVEINTSLAVRC